MSARLLKLAEVQTKNNSSSQYKHAASKTTMQGGFAVSEVFSDARVTQGPVKGWTPS